MHRDVRRAGIVSIDHIANLQREMRVLRAEVRKLAERIAKLEAEESNK